MGQRAVRSGLKQGVLLGLQDASDNGAASLGILKQFPHRLPPFNEGHSTPYQG